ncbi:hypothetical protein ACIP98_04245 [Streptomyces sp. NPDC088354]|uniref:hypothetical protein n=1 Tax=Streptomyces sp. NPDC088354 TaxID=3365856 RepID=UPI00381A0A2F
MFRKSDDTSRVRVAVMSLTAEAQFLEVRIRHLREEIAEVDTQLDALGESFADSWAPRARTPTRAPGPGARRASEA